MNKRIVAGGVVLLLIGLVFLGLSMAPTSLVMATDNSFRTTPVVANMMMGRLDITVTVVTPSWIMDLWNVNTGASINAQSIAIGTKIRFSGTLRGSDGLPIANYWVALNLLASGQTAESGNQCWLGSAKTDTLGQFGTGYYFEVRSDGWWSNYPGVDGAYIQTKNGAGNPGCQSWATTNPAGHGYSGYAAVSSQYYSVSIPFQVTSVTPPPTCSISGTVYVNDVVVSTGQSIRSPPVTTFAFVPSSGSTISTVTLSFSGAHTGSAPMTKTSEGKYIANMNWQPGTYTVKIEATCSDGSKVGVLSIGATVQEGSTQIIDYLQQIRQSWMMVFGIFAIPAVGLIVYGYKKHD